MATARALYACLLNTTLFGLTEMVHQDFESLQIWWFKRQTANRAWCETGLRKGQGIKTKNLLERFSYLNVEK